jgi:hypothetical protein
LPDERVAKALASMDKAIAAAPERDGYAFSDAVIQLSAVRDEVSARDGRGTPELRQRLTKINAVLSMILAGHFPLGDPPWDEIKKARVWLAELQPSL